MIDKGKKNIFFKEWILMWCCQMFYLGLKCTNVKIYNRIFYCWLILIMINKYNMINSNFSCVNNTSDFDIKSKQLIGFLKWVLIQFNFRNRKSRSYWFQRTYKSCLYRWN